MPLQICPKATAAYEDIRNDKTTTNWFTLEYKDESKDFLSVGKSGSGGLKECVGNLKADQALFIYLRILVGNDELSQRAKFVLVSWCGPDVKVMRRGKMSGHIADVKTIITNTSVEVKASTADDLNEKDLMNLLKKAMGANYDRQTSTY